MVYSSYHLFTRISSINPRNLQQDPLNGALNLSIPSSSSHFLRDPLVRSHSIFDGINSSLTIHVGIFTYIYHQNQPNVGKCTIHGSYGVLTKGVDTYSLGNGE